MQKPVRLRRGSESTRGPSLSEVTGASASDGTQPSRKGKHVRRVHSKAESYGLFCGSFLESYERENMMLLLAGGPRRFPGGGGRGRTTGLNPNP